MRRADIYVGLFLMAIGLLVLGDAIRLGFGWGMSGPEAGFFPFYMGLGIVICTFFIVLRGIKILKKEGTGKSLIRARGSYSDPLGTPSRHRNGSLNRADRTPFGHCFIPCVLHGNRGKGELGKSNPLEYSDTFGRLCRI